MWDVRYLLNYIYMSNLFHDIYNHQYFQYELVYKKYDIRYYNINKA